MRLRSRGDFDRVFQRGRKLVNRQLVVWVLPLSEGPPRLGLSVSRKVGGSPQRNRVKRCLREAFRHLAPDMPPVELIVLARPHNAPHDLAQARSSLEHILRLYARGDRAQERPGERRRGPRGRSAETTRGEPAADGQTPRAGPPGAAP